MKRKVLVFNLTPRMGMLHYSSQFCNELTQRSDIDLKVAIATYYNGCLYDEKIDMIRIRTHPSFCGLILDTLNIYQHIRFLYQIYKFSPDTIHFIDNHPWYSVYALLFYILGIELYTTQHDPTLHSGESQTFLGKVASFTNSVLRRYSDKVMVHGDNLRKELIGKYFISEEKVISIAHGSYTFFNVFSHGLQTKKDTFLFFGRIVDYKGLDVLLDALEFVKKDFPDFTLIIAGPGDITPYKKQLECYKDNIELYNREIEAEEVYKFFEVSEFVVLPYKDATGSGVIPVAYCFKKPVIVSDVGELANVVKDDNTGYVIESCNSQLLGEKIVEMLTTKSKVIHMGIAGKAFSDVHLGWKKIIDTIYHKTGRKQ